MNSSFFNEFLMISSPLTILFILVFITLIILIRRIRKKLNFTKTMIISTLLGVMLGIIIQWVAKFPADPSSITWLVEVNKWYGLIGYGFMDLLKMLVIPIVFVSIVRVIMNMGHDEGIGKLTGRSISMLLATTALAATIGIIMGNVFHLGEGISQAGIVSGEMKEVSSIVDTLRGLLPANPVQAMADANIVGVVIFAAFIGLAIRRQKKKYHEIVKPVIDLTEGLHKIFISISMTILKMMPYAVAALMANAIVSRGVSSLYQVLDFILALYISIAIMFVIHLVIICLHGLNPLNYVKKVVKPMIVAFTSRSSMGTLPVTIETLTDDLGVDSGTASFIASLGANMGMNGCAGIYPALMAVTIANMAGVEMNASFYAMLLVIVTIGSLGIAGIPGTAAMSVSVVISGMGMGAYFPLAGGILAIDPILDMGRTMINVNGAMTTAVSVGKQLDKINVNQFKSDKKRTDESL